MFGQRGNLLRKVSPPNTEMKLRQNPVMLAAVIQLDAINVARFLGLGMKITHGPVSEQEFIPIRPEKSIRSSVMHRIAQVGQSG